MKKGWVVASAVALLAMAGAAQAADDQMIKPYVGGAVGFSYSQDLVNNGQQLFNSSGIPASVSGDQGAFAGGLFVGAEINRNFEARLGYVDLGTYTAHANVPSIPDSIGDDEHWYAYTADLLIKVPLQVSQGANQTSVFLKLGAAATRDDSSASDTAGIINNSETDSKTIFVPGIGLKVDGSQTLSVAFEVDYYQNLAGSGGGYNYNLLTFMGGMFLRF